MVTTLHPPHMVPGIGRSRLPEMDDAAVAASRRASQATQNAASGTKTVAESVSGVDRAFHVADTVRSKFDTGIFFGIPILGAIGGQIAKLGRKFNSDAVMKTGLAIRRPDHYISKTSLQKASEQVKMGGVFQKATDGLGAAVEKTGAGNWLHTRSLKKAASAHAHATSLLERIEVPQALSAHVDEMRHAITGGINGAVDIKRFGSAHTALEATLKDAPELAKSAKSAVKSLNKLKGLTEKAHFHHSEALQWKNARTALPDMIGKAKIGHAAMQTSIMLMPAFSAFTVARGFQQNLESLKQMHAEMTGVNPAKVSTLSVLFGSVPAPVAQARSQLTKSFFIRIPLSALSFGIAFKQLRNISMKSMLVQGGIEMGANAVGGMLEGGESILPYYKSISDAHKSGQPLPVETYAAFIGIASNDLKAKGGAENAFTQEIAKQYAAEKTSPAQILKEIDNGQIMVRVHQLIAANEAAKAAPAPATVSHVGKLKGAHAQQPVVGDHTGKLATRVGQNLSPTV